MVLVSCVGTDRSQNFQPETAEASCRGPSRAASYSVEVTRIPGLGPAEPSKARRLLQRDPPLRVRLHSFGVLGVC
jgi:hypothetical protein